MVRSIAFFLFKLFSLFYLLLTSYMWLGVMLPRTPQIMMGNVILLGCLVLMNVKFRVTKRILGIFFALVLIFLSYTISRGLIFGVITFFTFLPALYIYILPESDKRSILAFITKWFGIIVGLGLIIYVSLMFVKFKPFLPPVFGEQIKNYPLFYNYLFYLKPNVDSSTLVRFQSIFLEPGHMAINCIMVIAANNYSFNKNKYLWPILAALLFSLSLAGYLLFAVGWVLLKVKNLKTTLATVVFGMTAIIGIQLWGGGDNTVNENILGRLESDKHAGIKGNNRTTPRTDNMFNIALSEGKIFFGIDNSENKNIVGAGWKKYLLNYGLIPGLAVFIFYWNLSNPRTKTKYAIGFYILIFLSFLDCEYFHWFSWMFCYTCGCGLQLRRSKSDAEEDADAKYEFDTVRKDVLKLNQ